MKTVKRKTVRQGTRRMINAQAVTPYGLLTYRGGYPMCYSGKTDSCGFLLGRDKYGSNVIIDFDRRTGDRTNSSVLILGNSGQGKSHLLRLLVINALEAGKKVLLLDAEDEYRELTRNLGGMYVDCSGGKAMINPLEPKRWDADGTGTVLAQHISFLRDWLRSYKPLTDAQADTVEILLEQLYRERGITKETDMSVLRHEDFPLLCELYALLERQAGGSRVFTDETLRELRLHLHSLCVGPDSLYFNGHTNIGSGRFVTFGVKSLLEAGQNLRDAMLFNIFSYMNNELLCAGNTVAAIDELYLYLNNKTAMCGKAHPGPGLRCSARGPGRCEAADGGIFCTGLHKRTL